MVPNLPPLPNNCGELDNNAVFGGMRAMNYLVIKLKSRK